MAPNTPPRCALCGRWLARVRDAATGLSRGWRCRWVLMLDNTWEHY